MNTQPMPPKQYAVTCEEIFQSLCYGKLVRFRGIQLWPGRDDRGNYLDVHFAAEDDRVPQTLQEVRETDVS